MNRAKVLLVWAATSLLCMNAEAQQVQDRLGIALVKMPYRGARNVPELSAVPDYLEAGGLERLIEQWGHRLAGVDSIALTPEEQSDYGVWHRLGLANGHLAQTVGKHRRQGNLTVGLLANCSSLLGVLGGLQHSGPTRRPLRVGLVFIDAHADFNTPETTLSGMLGGMPVAVAAGHCLTNLRLKSGLDPALPTRYIVMGGVRDTDPLEQERLDRSEIQHLSVADLRQAGNRVDEALDQLGKLTDVIYVHIDMDVLAPREVAGHPLTVPNGPTSLELAASLERMFLHPKVSALGIASTPAGDDDPEGISRQAAYNLIEGALRGAARRRY